MNRPPHVLCALYPALGHLLPALPVIEEAGRAAEATQHASPNQAGH